MGPVITLWVTLAPAHSGFPAQAPFVAPNEACAAYDREVPVRWTDSDSETPFGPAFLDIIATRGDLETFDVGQTPDLRGPRVATSVPEPDLTNAWTWSTATVAAGHYHLWTIVQEPPQEVASIKITERTPQVVTIVHPNTRVGPSVAVTRPRTPLASSRGSYVLGYTACDPTGTARVIIDVAHGGGTFERIAADLPAVEDGTFDWSTVGLEPGTWTVRATIVDDCGGAYTGYGRYYVDVIEEPDAGSRDVQAAPAIDARVVSGARCEETWRAPGTRADAGVAGARSDGALPSPDAGGAGDAEVTAPSPDSCAASRGAVRPPALALLLASTLARARWRRRSAGGRGLATSARPRG